MKQYETTKADENDGRVTASVASEALVGTGWTTSPHWFFQRGPLNYSITVPLISARPGLLKESDWNQPLTLECKHGFTSSTMEAMLVCL